MAQAAVKMAEPPAHIRRFEVPDLHRHGQWIAKKLLKAYPNRKEKDLLGWLQGLVYTNGFQFLYQDHAVSLAQVVWASPLAASPIVKEIFVFCEEGHQRDAVLLYDEMIRWAKNQGIDTLIVGELSDVPQEVYKEKFGRLTSKTVVYARV